MGQAIERVRDNLAGAVARPVMIREKRGTIGGDQSGIVIAVMDEWVAFQQLDDGEHLDALVLLRLDQIKKVRPHPIAERIMLGIESTGVPVETFPCPRDVTAPHLLALAAQRGPLVWLYHHQDDEEGSLWWHECVSILEVASERLLVHQIDSELEWAPGPGARPIVWITRVEIGGVYLDTIQRFADRVPDRRPDEEPDIYADWFPGGCASS